jgi:4a-hydroxytetrahydrobiopterin dehydratase
MCPMIVDEDPRAPLNAGEIAAFCAAHPPFGVDAGALVARFEFADFQRAFAFMTLVAVEANRLDHHPDWRNVYRTVEVRLWTHDRGAITKLDAQLAQAMVRAAAEASA